MEVAGVGERGRENRELFFNGCRVLAGEMEKFWRKMMVMVAQKCDRA